MPLSNDLLELEHSQTDRPTIDEMASGGRIFSTTTSSLLLMFLFALHVQLRQAHGLQVDISIGIGIGGGGNDDSPQPSPSESNCPPPPPPPPPSGPQPSDFPNLKQYFAYTVIQRFKRTITCDPMNISSTWTGVQLCTDYRGFYCDYPPNSPSTLTVAAVDFNGYRICAPTVSGFIDRLPDVALFHANSNHFAGTVPDLTSLPYLYELDVSNNQLTGAFPTNVLPLAQLTFLDLRFNRFSGSVPPSVFSLDLDVLFLNNNGLFGELSPEIGSLKAAYVNLANNGFSGSIPRAICNTSGTLKEILFLNNQLSGCLPYEIGLLKEATVFDIGNNRVTGPIPLSLGCLAKVEQLNLAGNLLYGGVPDVVCRLASAGRLENLSLSGNYFTSIGPSCWGLLKSGVLDIRQNCVPGCSGQRSAAECSWFFSKPKYCPYIPYIPCHLPGWWGGAGRGAPHPPPRRGAAPSSYATYTALKKGGSDQP